jgi:O-antigen/teichoic acid export membrane protein
MSLRRAVLTLLAGGALAQALPLLLGPWLTRLYTPAQWGQYQLFATVAANLGVVACARYEFALPMARDEAEAAALVALCRRVLAAVTGLAALGALGWVWGIGAGELGGPFGAAGQGGAGGPGDRPGEAAVSWRAVADDASLTLADDRLWPLWLPLAVGLAGAVSLATLRATRAQRFRPLAIARVLQYGGAAVAQVAAGLLQAGVHGLIAGPLLAATAAWAALRAGGADRSGAARRGAASAATAIAAPTVAPGPRADTGTVARAEARADTQADIRAHTPPDWRAAARRFRDYPLLNTPHAFLGALQDTLAVALIAAQLGPAAAGAWGLALRYLKAPATLVGGAVSQALHPRLAVAGRTPQGRALVRRAIGLLALVAVPLVVLLWALAPPLFVAVFGEPWREAGGLARALSLYIGLHFIASPLGVVTLAWEAQAWALKLALVGQLLFVGALAAGLALGGLAGAGWAVSASMTAYFGYYFLRLATWPVAGEGEAAGERSGAPARTAAAEAAARSAALRTERSIAATDAVPGHRSCPPDAADPPSSLDREPRR